MGFNTKGLTIFHKPWFHGAPTNAKKASGILTISGVVSDQQNVVIGDNTYEFDMDNNLANGLAIQVDVADLRNQATGTLTFMGISVVEQTVTIGGTEVYEFCTETATGDNIAVVIGADTSADNAVTKLADAINANSTLVSAVADIDNNTVVITAITRGTAGNAITTTETCTNASFGGGTLSGGLATITQSNAVTALVATINANDEVVTAVDGDNDTVVVTAKYVGTDYNTVATTETMANGSWASETLTGGGYATPCNASSAVIVVNNTIYFTDKPCTKYTENAWYSATPTLL